MPFFDNTRLSVHQIMDLLNEVFDENLSSNDSTIDSFNDLRISDNNNDFRTERVNKLGFEPQKEIVYNRYLPYNQQLDEESVQYLSQIKANIGRTLLLNDKHGFQWISDLSKYLRLYGYSFSKEDHIYFINTLYEVILIPGLELNRLAHYANVLSTLLKKRELITRDDLTIGWRPLYDLFEKTLFSQFENLGMYFIPDNYENAIKNLIRNCRPYFSLKSTQEMLDEWRPLLCPYDTVIIKATAYLELFLPTLLPPQHHDKGFQLWFEEFMHLWQTSQNTPSWEQNLISLFSRLANDTIGYIDWNRYIPQIFTHLIRSFNLMGGQHKVQITRGYTVFNINSVVLWLIAMLGPLSDCQKHVTKLFKAVESYYHPSNTGKWNLKLQQLLFKLPASFVSRIYRERYQKPSWRTPIPDTHKLTEENINEFVNSIVNVVMISMFSRFGSAESATALQSLSLLRPEKVIPPVLEKMYSSFETLTEPHRLTASMQCVVSVARVLVKGNKYYPEGPTHVLPLLISSLDGLDVNDMKKCMVTFQFIATFATLIPMIDCSSAVDIRTDLTDTEIQLCLATAQFEDFVLQFMDRCFVLIENSSLEQINRLDQESERLNTEEGIIEVGLASTFGSILLQCSPQILESAVDKLYLFVSSHIFETKVAGKFAAILVRSCSKANPELSLRKFLPHFCKSVLNLTESEEILNEEFLDHELLFGLQIISELVRCDGKHLVKYNDLIVKVLDRTLHLKCRKGYLLSSVILKHILKALTLLCAQDFRSIPKSWDAYANFETDLPIRDWGSTVDIHNLNVKWHEPDPQELSFAQHLLQRFLRAELNDLIDWTKGSKSLTREEVQRTLLIILDCICGAASALPLWSGEHIVLYDSLIPNNTTIVKSVGSKIVNFSNNDNIRETVLKTMRSTLIFLNETCEDDTKSLCRLIKIYNNSMFFWGVTKNDFDTRWKGFQVVKKSLGNKLMKKKEHIRALMIDRLVLQHEMRLMNKSMTRFTELHKELMKDLVSLATSHYSEVRCQAQETLFNCFRSFPYSYRLTLPDLMTNLCKDQESNHEQFKGSLYVLLGRRGSSLLTARDWSTLNVLWPALVNAKHSEKPSIIRLLDFEITGYVRKYFDTLALSVDIPDSCVAVAKTVWTQNKSNPKPAYDCPNDIEIRNALKLAQKRNDTNIDLYRDLIEKLVSLMEGSELHWRYYQLSYVLLSMLIRHDIPLPTSAVNLFTKNLIHDTLYIRKISIAAFSAVLKQMKQKHNKIELNPLPIDNLWLQTDSSLVISSEDQFDSINFIDKPHVGFYCFPKPLLVYEKNSPFNDLNIETLNTSQLIVFRKFSDKEFLDQFLNYLSLEEIKGKDKFSSKRFQLWKGLFRNFGSFNLDLLMPKITDFVAGTHESAHRCAAEIIAGCVRGSKHWKFEDTSKMISFLQPIMKQIFNNITTETLADWGTCSATIFENRDARRLTWILNIFLDDPLKAGAEILSSFLQASRLYLLHGAVQQQEWRSQKVLQQLLLYLEDNHLTHSYQNVRERIGSLLCNIFMFDVAIPSLPNTLKWAPKRGPFIDKIIPRLQILYTQTSDSKDFQKSESNVLNGFTSQSPERKDAANLLKTMSKWIVGNVPRVAYSAPPEMFKFLPILCQMQSETSDEELVRESFFAIIMLSHALLTSEGIEMAINISKQVCVATNWHARSAIATFLQYMVSSNLFVLMNNELWIKDITQMILDLLSDERTEVRESTAETLSGLLHCEFVKIEPKLIKHFETKSNHKLNKIKQSNGTTIIDPKDLTSRHSGILGLCACINAFPYDVPDFMPDILVFLSYHLNDPQPIPTAIKKSLSNFRRTHNDSWRDHKLKFSDDQLAVITDLLVSPNYYA